MVFTYPFVKLFQWCPSQHNHKFVQYVKPGDMLHILHYNQTLFHKHKN